MQLMSSDRRRETPPGDVQPVTFNRAESGTLLMPSARDFIEVGRDLSVLPLERDYPKAAPKFSGETPYAWDWARHKLLGGLCLFGIFSAVKFGGEAAGAAVSADTAGAVFSAVKALVFGMIAVRSLSIARLSREIREQAIAGAAAPAKKSSDETAA